MDDVADKVLGPPGLRAARLTQPITSGNAYNHAATSSAGNGGDSGSSEPERSSN